MSEHAPHTPEHKADNHEQHEAHHERHEAHRPQHEHGEHHKQHRHELAENQEAIAEKAKSEARRSDEHQHVQAQEQQPHQAGPALASAELIKIAGKRTLTRIRKDLTPSERVLSKVIHQPAVDTVSEAGSKTIARPSGILFGGIFAFLGTSLVLYVCKHYGYSYNFLLFALLFVGGFLLGLFIELGIYALRRRRAQSL